MAKISDGIKPGSALYKAIHPITAPSDEVTCINPEDILDSLKADAAAKYAQIESAEVLNDLLEDVRALSDGLNKERRERERADEETRIASETQNQKTNRYAMAALIVGIFGVLVAIFAIWFSWFLVSAAPGTGNSQQSEHYACATQKDSYES